MDSSGLSIFTAKDEVSLGGSTIDVNGARLTLLCRFFLPRKDQEILWIGHSSLKLLTEANGIAHLGNTGGIDLQANQREHFLWWGDAVFFVLPSCMFVLPFGIFGSSPLNQSLDLENRIRV